MEGVCVMDPQLRMVSTMTCSLMDRSELMFFFSAYVATLFYVMFLPDYPINYPEQSSLNQFIIRVFTSFTR